MRNQLFASQGSNHPSKAPARAINAAGGRAYDPGAEAGLAQMAMTCTLADSYYTSAQDQLNKVIELADKCTPEYVAKLAVFSRETGQMKDLPALLTAYLASRYENVLLNQVFPRTIDSGRMVRNFVQILRSGRLGRRGLGSQPKRLLRNWFYSRGADGVFKDSTGSNPSMADVIKLARPVPGDEPTREMYRYLIGKGDACGLAWQLKRWSHCLSEMPGGLPFEFLAGAANSPAHWEQIAMGLSWGATLKNLNTFARHKVSQAAWKAIETRLQLPPPKHVFPYGIMTAYRFIEANADIPMSVKLAVQDALDRAIDNVPALSGKVAVLVDTSGSMSSPVTGHRGTATGKTSCVEVASLVAAAVLRKNPGAEIIVFDTSASSVTLNPRDSVVTNARKLARNGGGTDISCGLRLLNAANLTPDTTIIVSDNESWFERHSNPGFAYASYNRHSTGAQTEWDRLAGRNKNARLICLDIQGEPTIQVKNSRRVMNLGGFSDGVFSVMADFAKGDLDVANFVAKVKATEL